MSYNIDNFKTREMTLELPRDFDWSKWYDDHISLPHWKGGCEANQVIGKDEFSVECGNWEIKGKLTEDKQIVTVFRGNSDGTGYEWIDVWKQLFKEYGYLKALLVWEGGDTVEEILIKDGEIKSTEL